MQQLRLERDRAVGEVEELRREVTKLKDNANLRHPMARVKSIAPHVDGPDERVMLEAEKRLTKQLGPQVGRPIDGVNPVLLYTALQGNLMEIDGVLFQLEVRFLAVSSEIAIYGRLERVKGS